MHSLDKYYHAPLNVPKHTLAGQELPKQTRGDSHLHGFKP